MGCELQGERCAPMLIPMFIDRSIETMTPVVTGRGSARSGLDDLEVLDGGDAHEVVFDAVLYPNRSLPNAGFVAVMSVIIVANALFGAYFYAIGAWPVIGFWGLDVLLVWLAFKLSSRQGRLCERVRVSRSDIWVARVLPSGHESRWRMQPAWTQIRIDDPVRHESQIEVSTKGETLILGGFLSPGDRADFARALSRAVASVRL